MLKKIQVAGIVVAVIVVAGIFSVLFDVSGVRIKEPVTITVSDGQSGNAIIDELKDSKVIKYPFIFRWKASASGNISKFKQGDVTVSSGMSYDDIIELLTKPNRNVVKVTIPEGYELRQIEDRLEENNLIDRTEFESVVNGESFDYQFLQDIPERENRLEGYLFPETYNIAEGTDEAEIVDMMLKEFDDNFPNEYYARAQELDMSIDEVVTLASIIERETSLDDERALVSGVFHNRLKAKMKLQSCATVEYILKERKPKLSNADISIDSKYNTYKYSGLPAGPIASPGRKSIEAALYPADTDAMYFVLGKDGRHIFSKTYAEHLKAKENSMYE